MIISEILVYSLPSKVVLEGEELTTSKLTDDEFIDLAENRGYVNTLHTFFNDIKDISEKFSQFRAFIIPQNPNLPITRVGTTPDDKLFVTGDSTIGCYSYVY